MNPKSSDYPKFKEEFWEWFDNLPISTKEKFWKYRDDMAETNFYFSIYSKKILTNITT